MKKSDGNNSFPKFDVNIQLYTNLLYRNMMMDGLFGKNMQ